MRGSLAVLLAFGLVVILKASAFAIGIPTSGNPEAFVQIDDERFSIEVQVQAQEFVIPEQTIQGTGGTMMVSGIGDPDPALASGISATDFGAPSTFTFFFSIPIVFLPASPSIVSASIVGGLTDFTGDGVTLTPLPPVTLAPDGDAVTETLVSAVGVGVPTTNMGVDVGLAVVAPPGTPGAFFPYGPGGAFAVGPIPGPVGPFTILAHEYNFGLTGSGDIAALTGFTSIVPVPEPSTLLLLGFGLAGLGFMRRRTSGRLLKNNNFKSCHLVCLEGDISQEGLHELFLKNDNFSQSGSRVDHHWRLDRCPGRADVLSV